MTINDIWYGKHPLGTALIPLSWLFCTLVGIRRQAYQYHLLNRYRAPVPLIIVGNITVGGTGKTPLVVWLTKFLKRQGFKPGIISRGYGGQAKKWPQPVYPESNPDQVGDEPVLLARQSGCPVVVAPQRSKAVQMLLENNECNLIISDDGLQHYALHRDIEIAVLDGIRRYGNGHCLPAGPLRESVNRLEKVDLIVTKGTALPHEFTLQYKIKPLRRVTDDTPLRALEQLGSRTVHAVAGIGHPIPFFTSLRDRGLKLHCHIFPDHHHYKPTDIQFGDHLPVVMTEKDAVKCQHFASPQHWYLPIEAHLSDQLGERLLQQLKRIQNGH